MRSPWQTLKQIQADIAATTWADSPSDRVFQRVIVTDQAPENALTSAPNAPMAVCRVVSVDWDPSSPTLGIGQYEITAIVLVTGDAVGESAVIGGGGRAIGSTGGRGAVEVQERVEAALTDCTAGSRMPVIAMGSVPIGFPVDGRSYVAAVTTRVSYDVSRQLYYPPARALTATGSTGTEVDLAWTLPWATWDRLEVVLRRASGSTAPSSPTSGTGVTLGSALATSVTDDPGAGTFSYALFAGYDEDGDGTSDRWSSAATVTIINS